MNPLLRHLLPPLGGCAYRRAVYLFTYWLANGFPYQLL